jgi:tripartite-type tricarboxylate transporter receptor subunit TctC
VTADTMDNTVTGRTDHLLAPTQLALADIYAGSLRLMGVSIMNRSTLLPAVPAIAGAGVTGFCCPISFWASGPPPVMRTSLSLGPSWRRFMENSVVKAFQGIL